MKALEAVKTLTDWDRKNRSVFAVADLRRLFPERSENTFAEGLRRLVAQGVLERAARGVYVYALSRRSRQYLVEEVAACLRRGEYNYISLESALSEFGAISQVPISRITVMTTGRGGMIATPYGDIEFTHTARPVSDILESTLAADGRPLRIARVETALRDLRRVGRNLHMVDPDEYRDILERQAAA